MNTEFGDFAAGEVREIPDHLAIHWVSAGLVKQVMAALLETKPFIPVLETKPDPVIKKRRTKKHESNNSANI